MKSISATRDAEGVRVVHERGDGSRFSYITATPERYGFPTPAPDHVARFAQRVDALRSRIADLDSAPEDELSPGLASDVPRLAAELDRSEDDVCKALKAVPVAFRREQTQRLRVALAKAEQLHADAIDASGDR